MDTEDQAKWCGGIILALLTLAIPITMVVLGYLHVDDCPMEPWIPPFMMVSGAVTIFLVLVVLIAAIASYLERKNWVLLFSIMIIITVLFLFGWNIAGNVWVFSKWNNWDDELKHLPLKGCHKETYLFIFSMLIIGWIVAFLQTFVTYRRILQGITDYLE